MRQELRIRDPGLPVPEATAEADAVAVADGGKPEMQEPEVADMAAMAVILTVPLSMQELEAADMAETAVRWLPIAYRAKAAVIIT